MSRWICPIEDCDNFLVTRQDTPLEPYECPTHFCPLIREKQMEEKKKEVCQRFVKCLRNGMDIMNTINACHSFGFEPDVVNRFMDDYGNKYQASPLEYQSNLETTRSELITNLENLYE